LIEFRLENMAKVAAKAEMDFRNNLKRVQSIKYKMSKDEKEVTILRLTLFKAILISQNFVLSLVFDVCFVI